MNYLKVLVFRFLQILNIRSSKIKEELNSDVPYKQGFGDLIWGVQCQHVGLKFYVTALGEYTGAYTLRHYAALRRVLRWCYDYKDFYRIFYPINTKETLFTVFTDASHYDETDFGHITIAFAIYIGHNMVRNGVKRRKNYATATAGSEAAALFQWYHYSLSVYDYYRSMGYEFTEPPRFFCDNQATLAMLAGGKITEKSHVLKPKIMNIRNDRANNKNRLGYVRSKTNPIDLNKKGQFTIKHS